MLPVPLDQVFNILARHAPGATDAVPRQFATVQATG
jgi:hypothetical protein